MGVLGKQNLVFVYNRLGLRRCAFVEIAGYAGAELACYYWNGVRRATCGLQCMCI